MFDKEIALCIRMLDTLIPRLVVLETGILIVHPDYGVFYLYPPPSQAKHLILENIIYCHI